MIGASASGMTVARLGLDVSAHAIANANTPGSGTDLAAEMPALIVHGAAFAANAAALRTQDETTGYLLDVLVR